MTASRSQITTLNSRRTNVKYLPFAITEYGAIQVANILRSNSVVEVGIYVVRKVSSHDESIVGIPKAVWLMNPPEPNKRSIEFVEL